MSRELMTVHVQSYFWGRVENSRFLPGPADISLHPSSIHVMCVFFVPRLHMLKIAVSSMFPYALVDKNTDALENLFCPCFVRDAKMTQPVTWITDAANFERINLFWHALNGFVLSCLVSYPVTSRVCLNILVQSVLCWWQKTKTETKRKTKKKSYNMTGTKTNT